jgi:hypothetical protein
MNLHLRDLREHLPHLHHSRPGPPDPEPDSGDAPIPGYNRMSERELIHDLHHHTQAELAAIEEYERTHANRPAVLHKLHYLRGRQPWKGYDQMPMDEILSRMENASIQTLKHVRDYEHKFRNRPDIVDRAMELHHELWAAAPHEPVPSYVPGGGGWVKG